MLGILKVENACAGGRHLGQDRRIVAWWGKKPKFTHPSIACDAMTVSAKA